LAIVVLPVPDWPESQYDRAAMIFAHTPEGKEPATHQDLLRECKDGKGLAGTRARLQWRILTLERLEQRIISELDGHRTRPSPGKAGKRRGRPPEGLTKAELIQIADYQAARRAGSTKGDFCRRRGIKIRALDRLLGKARAKRLRQSHKAVRNEQ
jgi:hypothetical protein